jgi:hypothetical protein
MKKKLVSILLSMAMCASFVTPLSAAKTTETTELGVKTTDAKLATPSSVTITPKNGIKLDEETKVNLGVNVPKNHELTAKLNWEEGSDKSIINDANVQYNWSVSPENGAVEISPDGANCKVAYVKSGSAQVFCNVTIDGNNSIEWKTVSGGNEISAGTGSSTPPIRPRKFDTDEISSASIKVSAVDITSTAAVDIKFEKPSGTFYKSVADFAGAWVKKTKKKAAENSRVVVKELTSVNNKTTQLTIGTDFTAELDQDSFYSTKEQLQVGVASQASVVGRDVHDGKRHAIVDVTIKGDGTSYIGTTTMAIDFDVLPQTITVTGATTSGINAEEKTVTMTYGSIQDKWLTTDKDNSILLFDGWTAPEFGDDAALAMKYKSSNSKIVKVDKKGKLTAKKAGEANVDVILKKDPTKKLTLKVVVNPKGLNEVNYDDKGKFTGGVVDFESTKDVKLAKSYKDFAAFKSKFVDKWAKKFVLHDGKKKLKAGDNKDFKVTIKAEDIDGFDEGYAGDYRTPGKTKYGTTCKVEFEGKGNYGNTIGGIMAVPFETQQLYLYKKNVSLNDDENTNEAKDEMTYLDSYDISALISDTKSANSFHGLTVTDAKALKNSKKVKYKSLDKSIAKVSSKGKVTTKKGGKEAKIEVWPAKNPAAKVTLTLDIQPKTIKGVTVRAPKIKGKQLSDSAAQSAFNKEKVVVKDGSKKLKYNVDYTVDIDSCAKGTLKFKVTGKGSYDDETFTSLFSVSYDPKTT